MVLTPKKIVDGHYEMWIPGEGTLNPGTGFLRPVSSTTLTNPATAIRAITVGAYDSLTFSYADFSGRGPLTGESASAVKPDLVAPGVNVSTISVGGGVAPHYLMIVDRENNLDVLTVMVEVDEKYFSDEIRKLDELKNKVAAVLKQALGVAVRVKLVEPKTIERSEGKAKRVIDNRGL